MLLPIENVLTGEQIIFCRKALDPAAWIDGNATAGHQSLLAKNNLQLADSDPVAVEIGDLILAELEKNALFVSAALPRKIFPPLFNRYSGGQSFERMSIMRSVRFQGARIACGPISRQRCSFPGPTNTTAAN